MLLPILPHMVCRQSPVAEIKVNELDDVALFRDRVEKLAASQLKYEGIPMSQLHRVEATGELLFDANTPDIDEIASLALKFRFFYAEKEPTQFQKVLTKVRRRSEDAWARGYLDWLGEQYKNSMRMTQTSGQLGLTVANRKIIDLWFNSELFHSDPLKRAELADIHETIGEAPSLFQLYVAIAHCSSFVRMLYAVVYLLDQKHKFIYTPNHHFGQAVQTDGDDI